MADSRLDHVRRVHIGGEVLQVRSDAPPETIEQVAEVVDVHVRRIQAAGAETDRFRMGVLAALHVAGELFDARVARDEAVAARDGILGRLAEAITAREKAEAERDEALAKAASTVSIEAVPVDDIPATVPERDGGVIEMRFDDGPAVSDLIAERDEARERCEALQAELDGLRNGLEGIMKRLEDI